MEMKKIEFCGAFFRGKSKKEPRNGPFANEQ